MNTTKWVIGLLVLVTGLAQAQLPATLTPADKVYGLSKFWQEVNYNFVYLDKVDRGRWDSTYRALITTVQQTPNDYTYYRELQKFCALLNDGHTNVYFPRSIELITASFGPYKLYFKNIGDKAIVVRVNASKKDEVPIGSELIEVNGQPTQTYLDGYVTPYISSSTDYYRRDAAIERALQGLPGQRFTVKLRTPAGAVRSLSLTHGKTDEQAVYPPLKKQELLDFTWYGQTAYVALNSFSDPRIDTLFEGRLPELYTAKSLIIDLRANGGGDTRIARQIAQYLTASPLLAGSRSASRLHIPTYKAWGKFVSLADSLTDDRAKKAFLAFQDKAVYLFPYQPDTATILPTTKRLLMPTVILLGHNTASAAEDFLIYVDGLKHIVKLGENSFGSTGQPYLFELPGGGLARVCTKKDTYPDGREFVGYGIKPDIYCSPTVADYIAEKDTVLEKALTYLMNQAR